MSSVQHIRRRIKSVKNINQITKAMEMVAASKLRRAQEATLASRVYAIAARQALARIRAVAGEMSHPLFGQAEQSGHLAIMFTSDRGLAGAYNTNVLKGLAKLLQEQEHTHLIVIGEKGAQFVRRLKASIELVGVYTNWPHRPRLDDVTPLASTAMDLFTSGKVSRVTALYTDFVSLASQKVVAREILPVSGAEIDAVLQNADVYEVEPDPASMVSYIVPRFISVQLYQAALEAAASEQAARMMAMKNASDNAKDLIEDLTLEYNGARQAAVTQELAEISAGAQAVL
jgi:F-type H+-transporting ATPase subunit gamma